MTTKSVSVATLALLLGCAPAPQAPPPTASPTPNATTTSTANTTPTSNTTATAPPNTTPTSNTTAPPNTTPTSAPALATTGCPCRLKEGGFDLELACGLTSCVDGTSYTCSKAGALTKGGRCGDGSSCACTVKVGEAGEAVMEIDCGLGACAEGRQKVCTKDGKLVDQGPCK